MTTKEEAKEIIEKIARKYGYLRREMMDDIGNFNAEYRREIDDNWLSLEHAASHSIKVLANNIYGSGARFVFELLQNAEDNKFTKADGLKSLPFISFKVHPKHIVVDCNEDGFTWRDLTAICSVGDSTKSAIHGYIGAKGIGFKSVFIAASRVHIQSGNFSFEFRHKKTDPGLGMVRPIWVRPVDSIPNPLTRTTLYLHDEGEQEDIEHLKAIISMQFNDLHETCLLFLCKLQQISVAFYDDEGNLEQSKQFRKRQIDDHRVSLETITLVSGKETTKSQIFHIAKQYATGLAPSDNREPPKSEDERQMSTTAEVVLAFPLTSDYEPQISRQRQELFAFLPLRPSDYKFHIHSDFDTNANRQDIITTSRRNRNIRDCIATAFYQAVLQFCDHPTLCYQWPLFLPAKDNSYDSFWSELDASIQSLIIKNRVLKSRNRNALRLISDVSLLVRDGKDENGDPLFDDTIKDPFLSPKYSEAAVNALKEYGFKNMNICLFVDLLKSDLKSANSKMRGEAMSEEWHSRVARLLSKALDNNVNVGIRSLQMIPLRDGRWTSCEEGAVYFPATEDIKIPATLNLRVVDSAAVQNRDRRALFERLGMSEATVIHIRQSINDSFASTNSFSNESIMEFLSYLYLTHQTGVHTRNHYQKVKIGTKDNILTCPHTTVVYLPGTDHLYSPESLLAGQCNAPEFPIAFLKDAFFKEGAAKLGFGHASWKAWLVEYVGIRERLSLLSPDGNALSEAFLYVFNHHADRFLGLFEHLWLHEGPKLLKKPALVLEIGELSAKQLCRVKSSPQLRNTWLPFRYLHELVGRYMVHPDRFPFLKIEGDSVDMDLRTKWNFLAKHFSVGKDDDIEFLLQILTSIRRSYRETLPIRQSQRVFDLYVAIYAKLAIAQDQNDLRCRIRQYFAHSGILDPEEKSQMWTRSSLCRWAAPASMTTVHSLKSAYARRSLSEEDMSSIENLFHRTLGIGNATSHDIIEELKRLQEEACDADNRILNLYKYLHLEVTWGLFPHFVGEAFEKTPLIFVRRKGVPGWFRASDCLWSSETAIRGKVTLDESYDELKDFFVHRLGVKSLTLQMVYDELKQSANNNPEDVKAAIRSLNEFLQIESGYFDPEPIRKAKVFPIRYSNGTVSLGSIDVAFAIGDRAKLKAAFEDKVSLLDFDLEDVRRLKPFFGWLGLQTRYLSNCVKEKTSISTDSGTLILSGKRFLKAKAYYITRVAATFNSLRFRESPLECYESLRTMDVREVDEISLVLQMSQNGYPFESRVATASEHISEIGGKLTIYVAKDPKVQDICFGSVLPRKLASWLTSNPNTNAQEDVEIETISALTSIFASDRLVLDEILDDQGIIQIPFDNDDEDESLTVVEEQTAHLDEGRESADADLQAGRGPESPQPPRQVLTPTDSSEAEVSSHIAHDTDTFQTEIETMSQTSHMTHQGRRAVERHSPDSTAALRPSLNDSVPNLHFRRNLSSGLEAGESVLQEDVRYRSILERVVEAARSANFPHGGAFDMQDLRGALPDANLGTYQSFDGLDVMESMGSSSQQERDKRVGAAGELYIFELLSKLELPGWGRGNWQSTIRKYATVHPDYADLSHWSRRETADLVYIDASGRFTNTLIEAGILTADEWSGKQPTYYFEVKTTTGPCKTPFYMSGNQYHLMERIHYNGDRSEVYMIFRIYSLLDGGRINYCVYMDPKKLRDEGRLVFTEGTWSVRPGSVVEQE